MIYSRALLTSEHHTHPPHPPTPHPPHTAGYAPPTPVSESGVEEFERFSKWMEAHVSNEYGTRAVVAQEHLVRCSIYLLYWYKRTNTDANTCMYTAMPSSLLSDCRHRSVMYITTMQPGPKISAAWH